MGKKMKFPFIFKTTEEQQQQQEDQESTTTTTTTTTAAASSWQWPSCMAQKTLSFRGPAADADIFKTMNSAYDAAAELDGGDPVEALISGLRTAEPERLFFEPGETSSILGEVKRTGQVEKEESSSGGGGVLVAMESMDPHVDFRASMEEMVEANGMKEWDQLEELLGWYLKANGKENHGYIVRAFADLLVGIVFSGSSSANTTTTTTTTATSSSSTCLSDSEDQDQNRSFSVVTSTTACSRSLSSLEAEEEIDKTVDSSRSNGC